MGDAQLLRDVLGAGPLLLTPEEAVCLLGAGCKTTIRQASGTEGCGPQALPIQPDVIAGWEGPR